MATPSKRRKVQLRSSDRLTNLCKASLIESSPAPEVMQMHLKMDEDVTLDALYMASRVDRYYVAGVKGRIYGPPTYLLPSESNGRTRMRAATNQSSEITAKYEEVDEKTILLNVHSFQVPEMWIVIPISLDALNVATKVGKYCIAGVKGRIYGPPTYLLPSESNGHARKRQATAQDGQIEARYEMVDEKMILLKVDSSHIPEMWIDIPISLDQIQDLFK